MVACVCILQDRVLHKIFADLFSILLILAVGSFLPQILLIPRNEPLMEFLR
jgi:hypothetical protein